MSDQEKDSGPSLMDRVDGWLAVRGEGKTPLLSDAQAIVEFGPRKFSKVLFLAIGLFLLIIGTWAGCSQIDEVTRGDAKVVPSGQNKVVQHPDGGIIKEIRVKDGDKVKRGTILLVMESAPFDSRLGEKLKEYYALQAKTARLKAQIKAQSTITFPKDILRYAPAAAKREQKTHEDRMGRLKAKWSALEQQVRQKDQEYKAVQSSVKRLATMLPSMSRELAGARKAYRNGSGSLFEVLRAQRQHNEIAGQLRTEKLKVSRSKAAMRENQAKLDQEKRTARVEAERELADSENKMAGLRPIIKAARTARTRTLIRSPVRGTVNRVSVTTIGAVVKAADPLVEIVPTESALIIEARIKPKNRAFIHPGQKATVKVSAYDFSIFGGLDGIVEDISADVIEDEKRDSEKYFRVRIRTTKNYVERGGRRYPIIPGMTASVDIRTGKKTVLNVVLGPVYKVVNEALRER